MSRVDTQTAAPQGLISFRGLWDKFASPGSLAAIRRAYLRGIPCVVNCYAGDPAVSSALAIVSDPAVNRRRAPLYLLVEGSRSAAPDPPMDVTHADVFAIDANGVEGSTRPIYRRRDTMWVETGRYVPVCAASRGLSRDDLFWGGPDALILFESVNVIDSVDGAVGLDGLDDDQIVASIRDVAGASIHIARVSDLVELDLLTERIREAA